MPAGARSTLRRHNIIADLQEQGDFPLDWATVVPARSRKPTGSLNTLNLIVDPRSCSARNRRRLHAWRTKVEKCYDSRLRCPSSLPPSAPASR